MSINKNILTLQNEANDIIINKQDPADFINKIKRLILTLNSNSEDYNTTKSELENIIQLISSNIIISKKEATTYNNEIQEIAINNDDDTYTLLNKLQIIIPDTITFECKQVDSWNELYDIKEINKVDNICTYKINLIDKDIIDYDRDIHIVKRIITKEHIVRDKTHIIINYNDTRYYLCMRKIQLHLLCKINKDTYKIIIETGILSHELNNINAKCITVVKYK
jgi:hypothetical protein